MGFVDVAVPGVPGLLTYAVPAGLAACASPGARVSVPLKRGRADGVVFGGGEPPPEGVTVRPLLGVYDEEEAPSLPPPLVSVLRWAARYYRGSPGEAARGALPPGPYRPWRAPGDPPGRSNAPRRIEGRPKGIPPLTPDQAGALDRIEEVRRGESFRPVLLYGVTGSGKTRVYLEAAAAALARGERVLVLVPEISLVPQTARRMEEWFGGAVAVLHSALGDRERKETWGAVRRGERPVVVGARSAVFAPLEHLGLVVVDEEQSSSYKQEEGFRYHARDVAIVRARGERALCLLGSATPSLESWRNALEGRYARVRLPRRVEGGGLPSVEVVRPPAGGKGARRTLLGPELRKGIRGALERRGQVILHMNRRGYAPVLVCRDCGWAPRCANCSVALVVHREGGSETLRCHHCGARGALPRSCGQCSGGRLEPVGGGSQRLEAEVALLFPEARVDRLDRDATLRRGSHASILDRFESGGTELLVGTQMVTKGLDFPGVTFVGVVRADASLHLPDFRAAERTFQTLTQVAGRAGRGSSPGKVVLQALDPTLPAVSCAASHDFEGFASGELEARRSLGYPPYTRLVAFRTFEPDRGRAEERSGRIARRAREVSATPPFKGGVVVRGPAPCPLERVRGRYRWHVLSSTPSAPLLSRFLDLLLSDRDLFRGVRVDVDPQSLL